MLVRSAIKLQLKNNIKALVKMFIAIGIIVCGLLLSTVTSYAAAQYIPTSSNEISNWLQDDETVRVILHRIYVCGEEIVELGRLDKEHIMMQQYHHPTWAMTIDGEHTIIRFSEKIEDLSPYCKQHAFFGIDKQEAFSLFDGEPMNEKIMKTFFQMNIPYLESVLPQSELDKLFGGIRVRDLDEYNSVLSTFSRYSIEQE